MSSSDLPDRSGEWDRVRASDESRAGPLVLRREQALDPYSQIENQEDEDRQRQQLAAIWGAIVKHRWIIAAIIVASILAGLALTLVTQPLFTAHTTLQIDRETSKIVDVEGLNPTEALTGNEFIDTQVGLLKSEALARRVVQDLNLAENAVLRKMANIDKDAPKPKTPKERERLEDRLTGAINRNTTVKQQGLSRLVRVEFTSPDPAFSSAIANALATNFQTISLERRFESSSYARKFLEERLAQVKQRLEESEKQLVAYGAAQQIINVTPTPEGGSSDTASQSLTAANLSALNSTLVTAQGDRIKAEQRWRQAQSMPILSQPEALGDPTIQNLLQQRATLAATYQERLKIYAPGMPDMQQLKAQMDEVDRQLAAAGESIKSSIRSRYEVALRQEQSLHRQVEGLKGSFIDLRERNIQNTILQREVDTNRALYDGLLQRYKEVGVAGGVGSNNIAVVDRAKVPSAPSSPKLLLNLFIALVLGLGLAAAATIVLELLDESIRTPDDIVSKVGLTVIGAIPELNRGVLPAKAIADPRSAFSEAYSSARTALQFATSKGIPRNLLITSSRPSEGKSTSAMALARSFAKLGLSVLLVDGDLRNPSIHRMFGIDNSVGFSNFLTGAALKDVVRRSDEDSLAVLPSGPLPPDPAELLASARLPQLLIEAERHFDLLIIDGPPVIGLADAPILASRAEATIIVVESKAARRSVLRIAVRRLGQARAKLAGALLTKFNAKTAGYGYGYGYGYAYQYEYGSQRLEDGSA
jgi:capsular exopolysaccharide synthesis family protein